MRTVRSQFARMPGPDAGAAPTIAVVAISEDLLEPYRQADTTADAERVLDELAAHRADLPVPIGDLFDELAEASAEEDDYELAAHLERKALDAGCTRPLIAREMLGWYLLKSGALEQGERVFGELRGERPDDVEILLTLGHARSDAGLQESALRAFDEAVGVAKRIGLTAQPPSNAGPRSRPTSTIPTATRGGSRSSCAGSKARSASVPASRRSSSKRSSSGQRGKGTTPAPEHPGASTRPRWRPRAARPRGHRGATTRAGAGRVRSTSAAAGGTDHAAG